MVARLLFLIVILGALVVYLVARFFVVPLWKASIEACRARDRELAEREESRRKEEEDRRLAERELESMLRSPGEPEQERADVGGHQGKE